MKGAVAGSSRRPLRITFVDQSGDSIGGAERSLELLLANLSSDIDVSVLLFGDGSFASALRAAGHRVAIAPLPTSLKELRREKFGIGGLAPSTQGLMQLREAFHKLAPDLVYTNTIKAHVLGSVAASSLRIPTVAHLRDILEGRARDLVRVILQNCSRERIAITHSVDRNFALERTTVISNPIDLSAYAVLPTKAEARAALALPDDVPIVGIVGRINRWKGQDRFLRVACKLAHSTNAHFAIVGEPIFRDLEFAGELRALAKECGVAERTHFIPWLTDPRVAYAALDINCNLSIREPFGRTLLEAAAAGVPSVCFDDGGSSEAIAPTQQRMVIPQGDLDLFAAAVSSYLTDPAALHAAGRDAHAHAARFDAAGHARAVETVIKRVLPPSSASRGNR